MNKPPGIVLMCKFTNKTNYIHGNVNYIFRKEAIDNSFDNGENIQSEVSLIEEKEALNGATEIFSELNEMGGYLDYMARPDAVKGYQSKKSPKKDVVHGVFSSFSKDITRPDIKNLKKLVNEAADKNSVMFQDIFSFTDDFLIEQGILNEETGELDNYRLYLGSKKSMESCIVDEGLKDAFWFGAIHRNTDNVHIHLTLMEKENNRPLYFNEESNQYEARGKRKQDTLEKMKSAMGNAIFVSQEDLRLISEIRDGLPKSYRAELKNFVEDLIQEHSQNKPLPLENDFLRLVEELPLGMRYYNQSKLSKNKTYKNEDGILSEARKKIDAFVDENTKSNPDRIEYMRLVKERDEFSLRVYGETESSGDYYKNKEKELKAKLGQVVLDEIRQFRKGMDKALEINNPHLEEAIKKINQKSPFNELPGITSQKKDSLLNDSNKKSLQEDKNLKEKQRFEAEKIRRQIENQKMREARQRDFDEYLKNQRERYEAKRRSKQINYEWSRILNDDTELFQAQMDFEKAQREAEWVKQQQLSL